LGSPFYRHHIDFLYILLGDTAHAGLPAMKKQSFEAPLKVGQQIARVFNADGQSIGKTNAIFT